MLYQKYRPPNLKEFYGNRQLTITLKGLLNDPEKIPHTMLFYGPTGCGKTTLARIVANELGCKPNNLIEIDTAQFRGIDTVRDLRNKAQFVPIGGGIRVFIVDEVHKMTTDAQNAFLKILEDTPKNIYFILCTTNEKSLLPTIRGRCTQFKVELLSDKQMVRLLEDVAAKEEETVDETTIKQIVKTAQGHPRNALTILEQVFATPVKRRAKFAKEAIAEEKEGIELCRALINGKGWSTVSTILKGLRAQDAEGIRRIVLGYATNTLLNTEKTKASIMLEEFLDPMYDSGFSALVLASYLTTIRND
ncbi:MAG: ATP-binding protein [bacterium]